MVTVEPYIRGTTRRNDIAVAYNGDGERPLACEEYDLAVCALTAPAHIGQYAIRHRPGNDRPISTVLGVAERMLAAKGRRKERNLPEDPDGDMGDEDGSAGALPFLPLIVSTGGLMSSGMREKLKEWKGWGVKAPAYSWMMGVAASQLVRSRARTFRKGE